MLKTQILDCTIRVSDYTGIVPKNVSLELLKPTSSLYLFNNEAIMTSPRTVSTLYTGLSIHPTALSWTKIITSTLKQLFRVPSTTTPTIKFTMFVPRRALFAAQRLPFARARPIAPLMRYSTEATKTAAPSATAVPSTTEGSDDSSAKPDVTLQKPSEDVTQVNQDDVKPAAKSAVRSAVKPVPTPTYAKAKPVSSRAKISTSSKPAAPSKTATTSSGPSNPYQPAPVAEESLSESKPRQEPLGSPRVWDGKHAGAPHEVDWEKSWFGIGSRPVTAEQNKVLARPINPDDVEVKPDGIVYLPEVKYRRRLNEAFGPMGWGMVNRGEVVVGTNIVTREYALIVNGR